MKLFYYYSAIFLLFLFISCSEKDPEAIDQLFFETGVNSGKIDFSLYSSVSQRQKVYSEDFNDNSKAWGISTTSYGSYKISGGNYQIDYNRQGYYTSIKTPLNKTFYDKNFEIEANIKIATTYGYPPSNWAGIIWNRSDNLSNLIQFSNEGKIWIGQVTNNTPTVWKTIEDIKTLINTKEYNLLTVRRINTEYYFFINKKFLFKYKYDPILYTEIGIKIEACLVYIDFINFYTL